MSDDIRINLNDLSRETAQVLVAEVMSLLSAFAAPGYDGSVRLSPQLAHELYRIAGIEDAGGIDPREQLCVEMGFHAGVLAMVACVELLVPEFKERLQERLATLERLGGDPAAEGELGVADAVLDGGQRITTVYMPDWTDPKEHHPYEDCPIRQQIVQSGEYGQHHIFASKASEPTEARRMRRNLGRRDRQWLGPVP